MGQNLISQVMTNVQRDAMLADLTACILDAIRSHGVLGVIIGVALESIIVPIPSPVVIMAAGAVLVEQGASLAAALPTLLFVITVPATLAAWLAFSHR